MNVTRFSKLALTIVLGLSLNAAAHAAVPYFEGFESPAWTAGTPGWTNFTGGSIQRVASGGGIAGVTSASGVAHAELYNLQPGLDVFNQPTIGRGSPYTQFGGYSSSFGPGFVASVDVYLDPSWTNGKGFDYSVAASNQSGGHLRDFMFHVGVDNGALKVNGSNNTDGNFNAFKLNSGPNYTVGAAGWYTLEQKFYDNGGTLAVDLNLKDDVGTVLYSKTLTTSDNIATTVGGNRYGWFTYNNIEGLALDNASLAAIPEPASLALAGAAGIGMIAVRRRQRRA